MHKRRATRLRSDLRAMSADAVAFSLMVGVGETYLPAFVLAIGLGEVTAGLIAAVPPLAGAILQLASPAGVRRLRSHRRWVIACAMLQAASFLPLIVGALVGSLPTAAVFLIASFYWGSGMGTGPAWNTWVGTLVPARLRPRYFARRTRLTQAGVLAGLLLGGFLLHAGSAAGEPLHAFAILFLIAFLCRLLSSRFLARQSEPIPLPENLREVPARHLFGRFRHSAAGRFLVYLLAVQTTVHVAAPYFSPYMLGQLELPYAGYMTLVAASFASKIAALPLLGAFARRFGTRQLLWAGGVSIVPLSSFWLISDSFAYLLCVQLAAGVAWGAYELATFLLVFETIHEDERTSVLTTFNLANAVAMVAGSLLGGALLHQLGDDRDAYFTIFLLSAGARALTLPFLSRLPRVALEPQPLATRTVAVRPSAGSIDRPILPSLPPEEREAEARPTRRQAR